MNKTLNEYLTGTSLTALAFCILLISNLIDVSRAGSDMQKAREGQQAALVTGGKVESQLDALAGGTQSLAAAGNPNAQKIVAILRQNGININAPSAR
jgi:hypothetical protein